ncbi:MAG: ferrous iron transport protein B, partial [Bacillota bacterium]
MDCCDISQKIDIDGEKKRIVLVGNPNVGKSIFFNYLTGSYVAVSNYPGTTLDISSGYYNDYAVIDTPGVYGVSSFNDEEKVARDVILSADLVINVVDAVHLERDLFLTQQIIDMEIPVIVALNMMDEAENHKLKIDAEHLSEELGVPVVPTVAPKYKGLDKLAEMLDKAQTGNSCFDSKLEEKVSSVSGIDNRREKVLFLEEDESVREKYDSKPLNFREEIYKHRRKKVDQIIEQVVSGGGSNSGFSDLLGRLMVKPVTGIPLLFVTLYLLYQLIGVFIAQTVVGFTEEFLFVGYYEPLVKNLVGNFITPSSFLGQILIGEFGVLTMTVTYTLGLLLPLVIGFFLFLSLLEDSGYMPRIAALVDRVLTGLGLNGRAVIPMLLGFGCVTMATITTRLLGSKRERIIAVFLLGLAIPCSAQLGVIAGLIAPLGVEYFMIYVFTIFIIYVLSGTILNKVLPGESTDLLIDIPPLRVPQVGNVLQKTYMKAKSFIKEAGPIFAVGAVVITVLEETGILDYIQDLVSPVTSGWLGLPRETATAFIMGIV